MTRRPKAVTLIGWYWTIAGGLGALYTLHRAISGRDLFGENFLEGFWPFPVFVLVLISVVYAFVGIGVLKGQNWAHILVVVLQFAGIAIRFLAYRGDPPPWINLARSLVFTGIMWFYLFRREASAFFKGEAVLAG